MQGLRLDPEAAARLYGAISWRLCPHAPGLAPPTILRWPPGALCGPAPILRHGLEWWGVFAWTLHVPASGLLFAVVAADTD
ncbi:hypothetical protein ACQ5SO_18745 [Rhodovulum sp. DZ06]|uniref:hypothetical protein n=1 Tax=Rhodovulum sp. DZ06 TaxID=3425126 RepID=UPI003D35489B